MMRDDDLEPYEHDSPGGKEDEFVDESMTTAGYFEDDDDEPKTASGSFEDEDELS